MSGANLADAETSGTRFDGANLSGANVQAFRNKRRAIESDAVDKPTPFEDVERGRYGNAPNAPETPEPSPKDTPQGAPKGDDTARHWDETHIPPREEQTDKTFPCRGRRL